MRGDHGRLRVQVEEPSHGCAQWQQRRHEAVGDLHGQRVLGRNVPDAEPAARIADGEGACIRRRIHHFDAGDRAPPEKRQHPLPRERRPVAEAQDDGAAGTSRPRLSAQPGRTHPVALEEQRVEARHAREPARERDARHRQLRLREQLLRQQQPLRLGKLHRRRAELRAHRPPQLPLTHAQLPRQRRQRLPVQRTRSDPGVRRARQAGMRVRD
jgi:hypothetical protein